MKTVMYTDGRVVRESDAVAQLHVARGEAIYVPKRRVATEDIPSERMTKATYQTIRRRKMGAKKRGVKGRKRTRRY